eukprot:scaffold5_cov331-Pavlova_lutheri.AAC.32
MAAFVELCDCRALRTAYFSGVKCAYLDGKAWHGRDSVELHLQQKEPAKGFSACIRRKLPSLPNPLCPSFT